MFLCYVFHAHYVAYDSFSQNNQRTRESGQKPADQTGKSHITQFDLYKTTISYFFKLIHSLQIFKLIFYITDLESFREWPHRYETCNM